MVTLRSEGNGNRWDQRLSGRISPPCAPKVRFGLLAVTQRPEKCEMAKLGADNAPRVAAFGHKRTFAGTASEHVRQYPGTPDQQSDTGRVAEPVAGGDSFFEQNEQGEARDPVEVHHPAEK